MKRQFSSREKGLIYALVCFIAFTLLLVCFILPGLAKLQDVKADRNTAEERKTKTETVIKNQAANEAALDELEAQAIEKTSAYYAPMNPEDADTLVSGMLSRYGFTPTALSIEPLAEATVAPYQPQDQAGDAGESDTALDTETTEVDTQSQAEPEPADAGAEDQSGQESENKEQADAEVLNSFHLTVSAEGTGNQVAGLVAEICLNPSLHLVSFDNQTIITEENVYDAEGKLTSTNSVTTYQITVTVELFTYDSYVRKSEGGLGGSQNNSGDLNNGLTDNGANSALPDDNSVNNNGTNGSNTDSGATTNNGADNSVNSAPGANNSGGTGTTTPNNNGGNVNNGGVGSQV